MKNKLVYTQAPAVVINSGDSNGYGVVINLGRQGIPVLSVDSNPKNVSFYSRYAKRILSPDPKASQSDYINFLIDLGSSLSLKPVLFTTGDEMVSVVLANRDKLDPYFHIPMVDLDIASKLLDKTEFYRMLAQFEVPHAKTYLPEDISDVEAVSANLDYPYILKPARKSNFSSKFHNKCLSANSPEMLVEHYSAATAEGEDIIVQQELLGTERYLVYVYIDSSFVPLGVCCYKKMRIFPIDYGNACVCETLWEPDAVAITLSTLKRMRYRGLAEAEIHRDKRDGQLKLVEINARSTTQTRLSARCGVNMEYLAYCDALDLEVEKNISARLGVKWINILSDFRSIFFPGGYLSQKQISLKQWFKSYRGEREYAFLAWDDPLPFTILFFRFVGSLCRKIMKRLIKYFVGPEK